MYYRGMRSLPPTELVLTYDVRRLEHRVERSGSRQTTRAERQEPHGGLGHGGLGHGGLGHGGYRLIKTSFFDMVKRLHGSYFHILEHFSSLF